MLLIIYFTLIILSFIMPKSNKVFYGLIVFLWFISVFCYSHADYWVYSDRYSKYSILASSTEIGYTAIMFLFNILRFDFQLFLAVIYAIILVIIGGFIKNNTRYHAFALGLYALASFTIDAVQLRNTMAFAVVLIGINILAKENEKKCILKYLGCIFIAATIHFSTIIYILFIIPKLFSMKSTIVITAIGILLGFICFEKTFIYSILSLFVSTEKLDAIYNLVSGYSGKLIFKIQIGIVATFIVVLVMFIIMSNNYKRSSDNNENVKKYNQLLLAFKCFIIILIIIPLIYVSADIYRAQRYLILPMYVFIINCFDFSYNDRNELSEKTVARKQGMIIANDVGRIAMCLVSLMHFYIHIVILGNKPLTFDALFNNNLFIK